MKIYSLLQILAETNNNLDYDKLGKIAIFIAIFVCCVPIILLVLIVCVKTIIKKRRAYKGIYVPKTKDLKNKNEHYEDLFGGDDNIVSIKKELNRVSITVKDLELVQTSKLQDLKIGVLIVGNMVKCSSSEFASYFDERN